MMPTAHYNSGAEHPGYMALLNSAQLGSRGQGQSIRSIDDAPRDADELMDYFLGLPVGKLAGCWVACVVAAYVFDGMTAGALARLLVVVAERLHGVTSDTRGTELRSDH